MGKGTSENLELTDQELFEDPTCKLTIVDTEIWSAVKLLARTPENYKWTFERYQLRLFSVILDSIVEWGAESVGGVGPERTDEWIEQRLAYYRLRCKVLAHAMSHYLIVSDITPFIRVSCAVLAEFSNNDLKHDQLMEFELELLYTAAMGTLEN